MIYFYVFQNILLYICATLILFFWEEKPCDVNNGGCDENADCTNDSGSLSCQCKSGFTGDGITCLEGN